MNADDAIADMERRRAERDAELDVRVPSALLEDAAMLAADGMEEYVNRLIAEDVERHRDGIDAMRDLLDGAR